MNSEQYIVEIYDPSTDCIEHQFPLPVDLASEIEELHDLKSLMSGEQYELRGEGSDRVKSLFEIGLSPDAKIVLRRRHRVDGLPYQLHTGRELLLMIQGKKPLSVFSEFAGDDATDSLIPEQYFGPFVKRGEFISAEFILHINSRVIRYVMYALPSEVWRLSAYRLLKETGARCKWSEGLERMEGSLLGYEDWQNDAYLEFMSAPR